MEGIKMIETENGWFIQGAYYEGVRPDMIGKRIIHVGRVMAPWGQYDGSGCTEDGTGTPRPGHEYVIVKEILPDGQLRVVLLPWLFGVDSSESILPKEWNTGKWVEVK